MILNLIPLIYTRSFKKSFLFFVYLSIRQKSTYYCNIVFRFNSSIRKTLSIISNSETCTFSNLFPWILQVSIFHRTTKSKSSRNNKTDACCSVLAWYPDTGVGCRCTRSLAQVFLAVLYAEFIALSSTSDANRKGIPRVWCGGRATCTYIYTQMLLQIEVASASTPARRFAYEQLRVCW